jgi:hypothetical protein
VCINSKPNKSEGSLDDESVKEREVSREDNGENEKNANDDTESKKEP